MDQALKKAMTLWPKLCRDIGLDPGEWRTEVLDRRDNQMAERVLLRLDGPSGRKMVFKFVLRPTDPDWFKVNIRAQQRAWEAYPEGVPKVLCVDNENQAFLMEFGHADTLRDRLQNTSIQEQAALLRRVGAWLDEYHRRLLGEERGFRPAATMRLLESRVAETHAGNHPVVEQDRFLRVATRFLSKRRPYWGRTVTARAHGDMHLSNFLIGNTVMGIDFMGRKVVPVGHDIGRLLSFYAISFAPRDALTPGAVLPDEVAEAFFAAYTLVGPDDPCVNVVLRQRVLAEWWSLPRPAVGEDLSPYARQVLSLVDNVFEAAQDTIWKKLYRKTVRAT